MAIKNAYCPTLYLSSKLNTMSAKIYTGLSFPLLVIIGALVIGAAGFFGIKIIHEKTDALIRKTSPLDSVEGKLIEELQRETSAEMEYKDIEIALQQKRINELLALRSTASDSEAETKIINSEIEEAEKNIESLELEKTAIMDNYWKELIANISPDTPVQTALDQLLETSIAYSPAYEANEQIIEQLREENLKLTELLDDKDREIGLLFSQVQALLRARENE